MVTRERFAIVKSIEFRVILPETDTVFCETDMVGVPGGGIRGWGGAGLGQVMNLSYMEASLPNP
jgi:hypothetical protein